MPAADTVVDRYIASWNERDAETRWALVAATFTEDAEYLDPLMGGHGLEEIDAMISIAQEQFPGHEFTLAGEPDRHSDRVRFSWLLAPAGEAAIAGGTDFAVLAADGRIRSVTGFLDTVD
jgi:hypothetical protein